jgi:LacI family transcriptional regulator
MASKNITIYDVAKKLNVSASTVSRSLKNHPDISEELKQKVKKMAEKLKYKPNIIAQSLKERKTKSIGVIIPDITNHFNMSILNGIEETAYRMGFHVMLVKTNDSYQRELAHVESLSKQVDGFIISVSQETKKYEHLKQLRKQGSPLVFVERDIEQVPGHRILMNDESISYALTDHMIKAGYKSIAIITGPDHLKVCQERFTGYCRALEANGISLDENLIVKTGMSYQEGRIGFQRIMRDMTGSGAIFCTSDQITLAVYSEAKNMKLQIGKELGIAAFSCDPFLGLLYPSVTGLNQKGFEMGSMAAQLCINDIENDRKSPARTEVLSVEMIVRMSTNLNNDHVPSSPTQSYDSNDHERIVYIY